MITYAHMWWCLLWLGIGCNRSVPSVDPRDNKDNNNNGIVRVLSCNVSTLRSCRGGGGGSSRGSSVGAPLLRDVVVSGAIVGEILSTNAQHVMLMMMLLEATERYHCASSSP